MSTNNYDNGVMMEFCALIHTTNTDYLVQGDQGCKAIKNVQHSKIQRFRKASKEAVKSYQKLKYKSVRHINKYTHFK